MILKCIYFNWNAINLITGFSRNRQLSPVTSALQWNLANLDPWNQDTSIIEDTYCGLKCICMLNNPWNQEMDTAWNGPIARVSRFRCIIAGFCMFTAACCIDQCKHTIGHVYTKVSSQYQKALYTVCMHVYGIIYSYKNSECIYYCTFKFS